MKFQKRMALLTQYQSNSIKAVCLNIYENLQSAAEGFFI